MYLTTKLLKHFEDLKVLGFKKQICAGDSLARGFADLGYEQFLLLPNNKLLSLFTATVKEAADLDNFFAVLSADQLVEALQLSAVEILQLEFVSQRNWCLTVSVDGNSQTGNEIIKLEAGELLEVLVLMLKEVLQRQGEK